MLYCGVFLVHRWHRAVFFAETAHFIPLILVCWQEIANRPNLQGVSRHFAEENHKFSRPAGLNLCEIGLCEHDGASMKDRAVCASHKHLEINSHLGAF
jgi:hypothetical protein